MKNIAAIILAAGRGTRMKSETPKVLQKLHSRPLLSFAIKTLDDLGIDKKILVVGHKDKRVRDIFKTVRIVVQKELLGSGDAVKSAKSALSKFKGNVLIICGDAPFIKQETIKELIKKHKEEKASCTLLGANVENPSGYGRLLRDDEDNIFKIVEDLDLSVYDRAKKEINVGCYCFNKEDLFSALGELKMNQKKGEYYITDVIEILRKSKKKVISSLCEEEEALGINSKLDLAKGNNIMKKAALEKLMLSGVTIVDPDTTNVDIDAKIGKDTVLYPNTVIEKDVIIGRDCQIGPFARIRGGTTIDDKVTIGNFVELVRTKVSSGCKIKHLTYLGDARVGKNVNIGAGTITANYDGKNKNKTIIEDGSAIGVGAILIAPVKIGRGAIVGAGSVVTKKKNVPPQKTVVGVPAKVLNKRK